MGDTSIEWTDKTWNPIRGCSRVSEGCRNCYAEKVAYRFSGERLDGRPAPYEGLMQRAPDGMRIPKWNGQIKFVEEHLIDPLKWKEPKRIFVNSMSDLFHENVTDEMQDRIFAVMALCPQHTFQILTKRPERMAAYVDGRSEPGCDGLRGALVEGMTQKLYSELHPEDKSEIAMWLAVKWPPPNVHLGVSCENQATADERIPLLLDTPAAVRFISAEPLLGPLDLSRWMWPMCWHWDSKYRTPEAAIAAGAFAERRPQALVSAHARFINWTIVGGESGAGARPMHPDWARSLRDQCQAAGVPYFFKQWGEFAPFGTLPSDSRLKGHTWDDGFKWTSVAKVGKKAAGATPDGREWREFPK
jgi:protein gp37